MHNISFIHPQIKSKIINVNPNHNPNSTVKNFSGISNMIGVVRGSNSHIAKEKIMEFNKESIEICYSHKATKEQQNK